MKFINPPYRIRCRSHLLCALFLLLPALSFAQTVSRQGAGSGKDADAAVFVQGLKQAVPYYNARYHLTVTDVMLNRSNRSVRLTVRLDADQIIRPEKEYYLPLLTSSGAPWDIGLLAHSGYGVCIQVNSDRTINNYYGYGGLMVILTNADLLQALNAAEAQRQAASAHGRPSGAEMAEMGRGYLVRYAQTVAARLPMAMGRGEYFVQCRYQGGTLSMTLEYDDAEWPGVRQFLTSGLEGIRASRARSLVADTTNAIAISAYVSESSVRHIYRNQACTDSVDFVISPRMLGYIYGQTLGAEPKAQALEER